MTFIPPVLRVAVAQRTEGRCEYCQFPEEFSFSSYEVDHVLAEQHGGRTELVNLAYACFACNRRKGPNIASIDPETQKIAGLYHPREQRWDEHFRFDSDGGISGLTPEGRATVRLLRFNEPDRKRERAAPTLM